MLSGSLAWVTGAGGGIGRQVCRILAQEGANVVVDDIDETRSIETLRVIIAVSLNPHERKIFCVIVKVLDSSSSALLFMHYQLLDDTQDAQMKDTGDNVRKRQRHMFLSTDVTKIITVKNTMDEIHNIYKNVSGCISPGPDIVVHSAGSLTRACLTTNLAV